MWVPIKAELTLLSDWSRLHVDYAHADFTLTINDADSYTGAQKYQPPFLQQRKMVHSARFWAAKCQNSSPRGDGGSSDSHHHQFPPKVPSHTHACAFQGGAKVFAPYSQHQDFLNTTKSHKTTQNLLTSFHWKLRRFSSQTFFTLDEYEHLRWRWPICNCTVLTCQTCTRYFPALPLLCNIVRKWS